MKNKIYLKNSSPLTDKEMEGFKMTGEEKLEAKNIDEGVFKSVPKEELAKYKQIQTAFQNSRTTPILIRFDEGDLKIIKQRAKSEGLPYQTFIKSIVHKAIAH